MKKRLCALLESSPLVALLDLFVVVACAWGAIHFTPPDERPDRLLFLHLLPLLALVALLCFSVGGLYRTWSRHSLAHLFSTLLLAQTLETTVWMSLCGWEPRWAVARPMILVAALLQLIVLAVLRLLLRAVVRGARQHERAMLVASDSVRTAALRARFESASSAWISIDACLGADEFLALPEAAITWDTVLVEEQTREKTRVIRKATSLGKSVLLVPGIAELWMVGAHLVEVDDQLLFRLSAPHLPPAARSIKRLLDVASAALLLTLTAPILLLAVLLIWFDSRGPVFYAQTRVGANGRPFTLYKLRTMVVDAEERTGPVLASSGDARITFVGRMLRATRIDELPQLGNVLLGEMSLIGPRPERPQFVAQYCALIPGYELRHAVKPGITGLAQVYGGYTTAPEHKLRFDLVYIYDYSLLLDLQIAFKTLLTVLRPDRAEGVGKDFFTPEDLYEQTMAECNNREVTRV